MDAFWIILTGSLVAGCCAILGSFLVLRKMAMIGDAISHAVLPGIVIAYLLAQTRSTWPMLIGAASFGVLTAVLIEWLNRKARLQSDAAIGLAFTFMFAIGVILISAYAGQVDLDQDCVLYGEIAYVPLDNWILADGTNLGPNPVWQLSGVFLLVLGFLLIGFKALKVTSFDPTLATALGISTSIWHYALMGMVSLTTVFSFESVGAILVVGFLIIPAATAYLLTYNLKQMIGLAVLIGVLSSILGYYVAVVLNGSIAGAITTVMGALFCFAWVYASQRRKIASLH
ncbi:MAG: metal ABC transporter permease [Bacteroidota bacterium]